ncbi:NrtA/SsuA/CpmA family ABC transporter substrate-binding protein [Nocardiopsis ansamitocini]|uniref:Sulfonate ABC transporter substrate-binding protein n=1 Tax=Nocardiopsis ansamitocini TaxID=1670832 RepID=A0A9W6P220_9ACTN|nr:NrtA/SsuA/CpmA family ABC transporter substrate-binding protein [Nocardiopsis ansamitocini]GLU45701.1 sulfonate ABC transporter substrate-binding protein [Nocardiopsis ansamitocini]
MSTLRPRAAGAAVLLAASLAFTACGTADEVGPGGEGDGGVIRVIDPGNAGPLAYAKREGIFEDRLAEVGATIEWGGSYASFTAAAEALKSGDVNLQQGAISPAAGALASTDELRIFSVSDPLTDPAPVRDGLVVPAGSDVTGLADLEGRRVAVNQAGKGEYLLLRALEAEGVDPEEVDRVYLNPQEGAAAFGSGKVDAWWAIVNAYPEAVASGADTIVTSRDVDDADLGIFAARTDLLEEHPEAVKVFFDVLNELIEEGQSEPEKFQNVFLDQGPTAVDGDRLAEEIELTRATTVYRYPTEDDLAKVETVGRTFADHGVLPDPITASDVVFDLPAALS